MGAAPAISSEPCTRGTARSRTIYPRAPVSLDGLQGTTYSDSEHHPSPVTHHHDALLDPRLRRPGAHHGPRPPRQRVALGRLPRGARARREPVLAQGAAQAVRAQQEHHGRRDGAARLRLLPRLCC